MVNGSYTIFVTFLCDVQAVDLSGSMRAAADAPSEEERVIVGFALSSKAFACPS